ncbi:hypothetical protein [Candidatus Tisiphia endosymbiont of Mystacides longicornis]|uniref:hypothetical protein n=1 Tax=Candidatus Tisiphia endosymbiont of Mystacides longicornis TaxID=3139330 RepID=UPI003CCB5420
MSKAKLLQKMMLPIIVTGMFTGVTYEGYKRSSELSKFEIAAKGLGFTSPTQQDSLLKILHLAGYLQPEKLWRDLACFDKTGNSEKIFASISRSLIKSRATQDAPDQFDAKLLRKNLFKATNELSVRDVEDWLLYVAQNAFNRKVGQERNELTNENWMIKYASQYIDAAKQLGLIDEIPPQHQEYAESWIAGASRIGLLARIIYYNKIIEQIKINGSVLVLAGARPLWANIDGINPKTYDKLLKIWQDKGDINKLDASLLVGEDSARTEEGKEYMGSLAKSYNIVLELTQPFIQYTTKEECPAGFFPGRVYPNYATTDETKLTESLMSEDLLNNFLNKEQRSSAEVINTELGNNNARPNTATTAYDAAVTLVDKILSGGLGEQKDYVILFISNNPYIQRQTIATQREVDKILQKYGLDKKGYHIEVEGVGFSSKQDVPTIHSELACLIAELWKNHNLLVSNEAGHSIEKLLFQTRQDLAIIPPMPEVKEENVGIIGQMVLWTQDVWDHLSY